MLNLRNNIILGILMGFCFNAVALVDPTRPSGIQDTAQLESNSDQLILNGIITKGSTRSVIINNKNYNIGDQVQDGTIDKITDNEVVLSNGQTLLLFQDVTGKKGN